MSEENRTDIFTEMPAPHKPPENCPHCGAITASHHPSFWRYVCGTEAYGGRGMNCVIDCLRRELAALTADKAQLDWLENNKGRVFGIWWENSPGDNRWTITGNPTDPYSGGSTLGNGDTLRDAINDAIDNAMKEETK